MINSVEELKKFCVNNSYQVSCAKCEAVEFCGKHSGFKNLFQKILQKRRKEKLKKLLS